MTNAICAVYHTEESDRINQFFQVVSDFMDKIYVTGGLGRTINQSRTRKMTGKFGGVELTTYAMLRVMFTFESGSDAISIVIDYNDRNITTLGSAAKEAGVQYATTTDVERMTAAIQTVIDNWQLSEFHS